MALEGARAAEFFSEVENTVAAAERDHDIETSVILNVEIGGTPTEHYHYNPEKPHTAASLSKLGVAYSAGGDSLLGDSFPNSSIVPYQRANDGGEGELDKEELPETISFKDLVVDMLARSGNTAQRVLVYLNGGPANVNRDLRRFEQTHLEDLGDGGFYCGVTSAQDALKILRTFRESAVTYGSEYDQLVLRSLGETTHRSGLLHEVGPLKSGERVATKFGLLDDYDIKSPPHNVRHEAGLFEGEHGRLYVAVLNTVPYGKQSPEEITARTLAAEELIRDIGSRSARAVGLLH
jgi:hypothetical protein